MTKRVNARVKKPEISPNESKESNTTDDEISSAIIVGFASKEYGLAEMVSENIPHLYRHLHPSLIVTIEYLIGRIQESYLQQVPAYEGKVGKTSLIFYPKFTSYGQASENVQTAFNRLSEYLHIGLLNHEELGSWFRMGDQLHDLTLNTNSSLSRDQAKVENQQKQEIAESLFALNKTQAMDKLKNWILSRSLGKHGKKCIENFQNIEDKITQLEGESPEMVFVRKALAQAEKPIKIVREFSEAEKLVIRCAAILEFRNTKKRKGATANQILKFINAEKAKEAKKSENKDDSGESLIDKKETSPSFRGLLSGLRKKQVFLPEKEGEGYRINWMS